MIRDLTKLDLQRLNYLHRIRGFQYDLPDILDQDILVKVGYEDIGQYGMTIQQAVIARSTVELYMLADPDWKTPKWRMEALRALHDTVEKRLASIGIKDAFVWVPPQIQDTFGKRLQRSFGWVPAPWVCMTAFVRKDAHELESVQS